MKYQIDHRLSNVLLPWYYQNRRDLPWRKDRDPYHIWVSEIMLQQTRVEAVKGYYTRFLEALPTVEALAACDDDRLHKLWEGLGYYSRVRNLKKCAVTLMERYGGKFPRDYPAVLALPGIGAYTAGAICSICFDMPTPAVDGNVLRVVSRLTEDSTPIDAPAAKAAACNALAAVYPAAAGDFTQALMELGATVCGPNRKPDCDNCPCHGFCAGANNGTAEKFPVKAPKKQRKTEEMTVFILSCDEKYALQKRGNQGLLAGLWQFPNCPGKLEMPAALETVSALGCRVKDVHRQVERQHIFTHIQWNMRGIYLETENCAGDFTWMTAAKIQKETALPTAFRQFWEEIENV